MIAWLFWLSLVVLIYFGWVWLVATFAPDLAVRILWWFAGWR